MRIHLFIKPGKENKKEENPRSKEDTRASPSEALKRMFLSERLSEISGDWKTPAPVGLVNHF